jgi:tetratricopeptide (TPR) repeat protein
MKKIILVGVGVFLSLMSQSQSLKETMRMAENERFESAKNSFRNLVIAEPSNGDIYYYFGETYFNQSLTLRDTVFARVLKDSASIMYKKGSEVDPANPLNFVGLGKILWYNKYQNQAEVLFKQALDMTKSKNATVMLKIAETYINADFKSLKAANELLAKALKLEPKNPDVHILIGDAMLEADPMDGSGPVKKYNEAAALDVNSAKPILRIGKLYYRAKNPNEALRWYKEAIKIDSTFAPAYLEMGELYIMASINNKALESYKKYLILNNDKEARDRFSQVLWLNKLFEDAVNEISKIQLTDSSSYTLYRLLGYSYSEVGDKFAPDGYKKGLYAMRKFFDMTSQKTGFKYLSTDYSVVGKLLSKTGQDSLGIVELKRALEMDTTKKILNSDIALAYYKIKKYNDAIYYYSRKIAAGDPTVNDYLYLGSAYYASKQFALADSAFKKVTTASPELTLAYKYRAKCNVQLDPDSKLGLAKPHYEKVMELILAKPELLEKGNNKKDLIEAYEYLGAYNLIILKDKDKATEFFTKIKDLDPNNKKVIDFFKDLEKTK